MFKQKCGYSLTFQLIIDYVSLSLSLSIYCTLYIELFFFTIYSRNSDLPLPEVLFHNT